MDPWFAAPLGLFIGALVVITVFGCVYAVDWWLWKRSHRPDANTGQSREVES